MDILEIFGILWKYKNERKLNKERAADFVNVMKT